MDIEFPADFVWGAATASYQIEGAWNVDGKGQSIWDSFSHKPGKIRHHDTGSIACDHYHLYKQDIAFMANLGLQAYRFSTAWTRIFPEGRGKVNRKGRDFYDALIDELLEHGISPWLCFYHWDLPQALQDKGGWQNRDMIYWFADYAAYVAEAYGDRVRHFISFNEANTAALLGHLLGTHAPGKTDAGAFISASHHFNLATGILTERLRSLNATWQLGTILSLDAIHPETDTDDDIEAALLFEKIMHKGFLDPLYLGSYPSELQVLAADIAKDDDLSLIWQPQDFLGVNYYSRKLIRAEPKEFLKLAQAKIATHAEQTAMGEVYPEGLYEQLIKLKNAYGNPSIYISANGTGYPESDHPLSKVADLERIGYLERHLEMLKKAMDDGVKVKGYFLYSILDGFAWEEGYSKRFGLIHVDYESQKRSPKQSFDWYQTVIREGGFSRS